MNIKVNDKFELCGRVLTVAIANLFHDFARCAYSDNKGYIRTIDVPHALLLLNRM